MGLFDVWIGQRGIDLKVQLLNPICSLVAQPICCWYLAGLFVPAPLCQNARWTSGFRKKKGLIRF